MAKGVKKTSIPKISKKQTIETVDAKIIETVSGLINGSEISAKLQKSIKKAGKSIGGEVYKALKGNSKSAAVAVSPVPVKVKKAKVAAPVKKAAAVKKTQQKKSLVEAPKTD